MTKIPRNKLATVMQLLKATYAQAGRQGGDSKECYRHEVETAEHISRPTTYMNVSTVKSVAGRG